MANKIIRAIFLLFMMYTQAANAQVTVSGPSCVLAGLQCQYIIGGINTDSVNVRVCVTGGTIVGSDSTCTEGMLSFVRIIWTDSNYGNLSISSIQGNTSLDISVTHPLLPGTIDTVDISQVTDTVTVPHTIHCPEALNGNCNPNYQYQWQQFVLGSGWTDIVGGTMRDLIFTSPVTQTTYYRRKVTDSGNTEGFSNEATVVVNQVNQ